MSPSALLRRGEGPIPVELGQEVGADGLGGCSMRQSMT